MYTTGNETKFDINLTCQARARVKVMNLTGEPQKQESMPFGQTNNTKVMVTLNGKGPVSQSHVTLCAIMRSTGRS